MFNIAGIKNVDIEDFSSVWGKNELIESLTHDFPRRMNKIKIDCGKQASNILFTTNSIEDLRRTIYYVAAAFKVKTILWRHRPYQWDDGKYRVNCVMILNDVELEYYTLSVREEVGIGMFNAGAAQNLKIFKKG